MPRTKRPTKKTEKVLEEDDTLKKLDKLVASGLQKIEEQAQMEARDLSLAFKILIGSYTERQLNMTVGQLKNELYLKGLTTSKDALIDTTSESSTRPASHDDGYNTEHSQGSGDRGRQLMAPPSRRSARRSRSADASARKAPAARTATVQRRRSKSVYKTPAYKGNAGMAYPAITPKVAPHTPLALLRQPRQGEMVVSMTGSPVMVPTYNNMQQDEKANCNIMLKDGTMLSLQPKQLRQSQAYIPFSLMDNSVLAQLKTLKDNLDKVVKMGEKNLK